MLTDFEKKFYRYCARNEDLQCLGYQNYKEYLGSSDWKEIRRTVLELDPLCILCSKQSEVVHHIRYTPDVLLGLSNSRLAALCNKCHEKIEIEDDGKKGKLERANAILFKDAMKTPQGLRWRRRYFDGCRKAFEYLELHKASKRREGRKF